MDTHLIAQAEHLRQTAERLARVGLVLDRTCLSPEQRRVIFALQRLERQSASQPAPKRVPIGFAYPTAR